MIWISSGSISQSSERRLPSAAERDWCSEDALLRRTAGSEDPPSPPPGVGGVPHGRPPSQLLAERADGASGSVVPVSQNRLRSLDCLALTEIQSPFQAFPVLENMLPCLVLAWHMQGIHQLWGRCQGYIKCGVRCRDSPDLAGEKPFDASCWAPLRLRVCANRNSRASAATSPTIAAATTPAARQGAFSLPSCTRLCLGGTDCG
jgi:hypothetical protein